MNPPPLTGSIALTDSARFVSTAAWLRRLQKVPAPIVMITALVSALIFRLALTPVIGGQFPFATFYIAVVLCAIQGGIRLGAIAAVAGYFLGNYFVGDRVLFPRTSSDLIGSLIYLLNCSIVLLVTEAQRTTFADLQAHARALEAETEERRQVEIALRKAEARYRALSELTSDFAYGCRVNEAGKVDVEWVSDVYTRVTGWTKEDLNERGIAATIHPDDLAAARLMVSRVLAGNPEEGEYRSICRDGRLLWLRNYARPLETDSGGKVVRFIGAAQDITARREQQAQTESALNRLNLVLEGAGLGTWEYDPQSGEFYGDERGAAIHGLTGSEVRSVEEALRNIITEEQILFGAPFDTVASDGGDYRSEYPVHWPDGSRHWVACYGRRINWSTGLRMLGIVQDITERKAADEALRLSEARYRVLTEDMPQLVWTVTPIGRANYANNAFYEYTGLSRDTPIDWGAIALPEDRNNARQRFVSANEAGQPYTMEYRFRRGSDGEYRWHLARVAPVLAPDGAIVQWIGTALDIHDRKLAQQEREQAMLEIETLNARLRRAVQETHHRVKNNLQVIAALAEMEAHADDLVPVTVLQRISQHARTLALIHDILTQQSRELGVADDRILLSQMMERLLPLVRSTIGERAIHYAADDFTITAREGGAIALLVSELVSNAVKHGGTEIWITFRRGEGCVHLVVEDNGPGFPDGFDAVLAAHTGLELVVSAARWDLRGDVTFGNAPSGGARIAVSFPLA